MRPPESQRKQLTQTQPIVVFLLWIAQGSYNVSLFIYILRFFFHFQNNIVSILIVIGLVAFDKMIIFTILIVAIREHKMLPFSCVYLGLFLQKFEVFTVQVFIPLDQAQPSVFYVQDAIINRRMPMVSFSVKF